MKGPPTVLLHKSFRIEFESSSNRVGGAYCIQTGGEEQREFFARIRRGPTLCCCCVSVLKPKNIFFLVVVRFHEKILLKNIVAIFFVKWLW